MRGLVGLPFRLAVLIGGIRCKYRLAQATLKNFVILNLELWIVEFLKHRNLAFWIGKFATVGTLNCKNFERRIFEHKNFASLGSYYEKEFLSLLLLFALYSRNTVQANPPVPLHRSEPMHIIIASICLLSSVPLNLFIGCMTSMKKKQSTNRKPGKVLFSLPALSRQLSGTQFS